MNKKIFTLSIILVALIAIITGTTFAWLTATGSSSAIEYKVGDVEYTITGTTAASGATVVPGQTIDTTFTITNSSNVATHLRVKIEVSVNVTNAANPQASANWAVGAADTDHLNISTPTGSKWVVVDDYLYYIGKDLDDASEDIAANTNPESLVSQMVINGKLIGNDYSGAVIKITATFEAKQADYVTWTTIGSIQSFEAGI